MTCLLETVKELESCLNGEECYLFGAGVVAKAVLTWMRREGLWVKSVIISNRGTATDIMGFPLKEISEITDIQECRIVVALMEKSHAEIEFVLQKNNVLGATYISDALYYNLECENGNYDIKEIYLLNWIKWKLQSEGNKFQEERKKYRWRNESERKITQANWGNYYEKEDFAVKFRRLIHGLDQQSIETVTRIVNRQKRYLSTDASEIDLYTAKEKKEIEQLSDDFYALIMELSPGLYMYKEYFLTRKVFEASVFYYKHGVHKLHNPERLENGVFFDVGGYVGDSAIVFQELHPKCVYSFEALPQHCREMEKNLELNNIKNVVVENMALGNESKRINMEICGSASNCINRWGFESFGTVEVQMETLDTYILEHNIQECTLIKVDIEGSEPYFLEGAKQTISRFKPTLLLSIYHNEHDFFGLKPLIESWNLGYKFQIYKPFNGNLTNETLLLAEAYE